MDQTTDTLVLDTAWEIQEQEQRYEQQALPVQSTGTVKMHNGVHGVAQPRLPQQAVPAPSIGERWIADAIRWVSARVRRDGGR